MHSENFDAQPVLDCERFHLEPLQRGSFENLYAAAADPAIWAGHPSRDRYKRSVFSRYFEFLLETRRALTVTDRRNSQIIGCSSYYTAPDMPGSISIGFTFLTCPYWGGRANFDVKKLMLDHAFNTFEDVWFHIDPTNIRSQKATAKLGAVHEYDPTLDLSGTPVKWMCFKLTKEVWDRSCREKGTGGL